MSAAAGIADEGARRAGFGAVDPGEPIDDRLAFLSTDIAGRREFRFAGAAVLISGAIFAAAAPLAKTQLGQLPAFIPIYASALVVCDVITTVLLFSQFVFLRSWPLLILAGGYLFTGLMTVSYTMVFPGLFSPMGLLGAGPQTTSAMYMFWHGGFPVAVIGYAMSKGARSDAGGGRDPPRISVYPAILSCIAAIGAIVFAFTVFVTSGHDWLPELIQGNRTTDLGHRLLATDWMLSLLALAVLWRRRPHAVIDLWLMAAMCAWLFDIALSAILNSGRYDLGWYAGRIYGLLAASSLLGMLLIENSKYYSRMVLAARRLKAANEALERLSQSDGLTNIGNRRLFDVYLAAQIALARRRDFNLALVICDVDAFKEYNDHYGHQAGDDCLRRVAGALDSCRRRPEDMVARIGGEEFAMILPDTDIDDAIRIAEAARAAVVRLSIPHEYSPTARCLSISGGVAVLSGTVETSAQDFFSAADQGLYQAKRLGRNRIVCIRPGFGAKCA